LIHVLFLVFSSLVNTINIIFDFVIPVHFILFPDADTYYLSPEDKGKKRDPTFNIGLQNLIL
jgi:hypothetical protein